MKNEKNIRIGILGSDNSHALAFAKLCNIPDDKGLYAYDNIRVTAIYGKDDDAEHTAMVAREGRIEFIAQSPAEFFGKVDAVMVVYRRGSYHIPDILPFIEKGIPCWIDKPICSSVEDIQKLREACEKSGALVTGGSTMKYCYDILTAKNRIESGFFGKVLGGNMNFPGDFDNPYEGLYFYGSHLIEMMLTVFGYDVVSVVASENIHDRIAVIANYENCQVTLNFTSSSDFFITVYGSEHSITTQADISNIYKLGFDKFVEMLRTGRMPLSFDEMVKPVYILDAIHKSVEEKREVYIV